MLSLNPGSPEAILAGCKCPEIDNHYGKGWEGTPNVYCINGNCPLHGKLHAKRNKETT